MLGSTEKIFQTDNAYINKFFRSISSPTYIATAMFSLLIVVAARIFNVGSLFVVSCGIASLVIGFLLANTTDYFSNKSMARCKQAANNLFQLVESSQILTFAYQNSNAQNFKSIGFTYNDIVVPFLKSCYECINEMPEKIVSSLPTYALILSICSFSERNKNQYPSSVILENDESYQEKAYFLPLIYNSRDNAKDAIISLFQKIKSLSADKKPPRIAFPLGCSSGDIPHVVTAVVDFSKEGGVSCLIFDPISHNGYRKDKDSFIQNLRAIFPEILKVTEPNVRFERYDMTKCAVWCFTFHEFLARVSVSCAQEGLTDKFLAFVDSKYLKLCEKHGSPVSIDLKQKEISFMSMQFEYMKSLVSAEKIKLETKVKVNKITS